MLSGKGTAPKNIASDADILKAVADSKGAIGYVDSASVTGDVKALKLKK